MSPEVRDAIRLAVDTLRSHPERWERSCWIVERRPDGLSEIWFHWDEWGVEDRPDADKICSACASGYVWTAAFAATEEFFTSSLIANKVAGLYEERWGCSIPDDNDGDGTTASMMASRLEELIA